MLMKLTSVLIFFFFPRPPLSQDITDKNGEVLPKGELTGDAEKKIGKKSERLFLKNCFFFEAWKNKNEKKDDEKPGNNDQKYFCYVYLSLKEQEKLRLK